MPQSSISTVPAYIKFSRIIRFHQGRTRHGDHAMDTERDNHFHANTSPRGPDAARHQAARRPRTTWPGSWSTASASISTANWRRRSRNARICGSRTIPLSKSTRRRSGPIANASRSSSAWSTNVCRRGWSTSPRTEQPALIAETDLYKVYTVRWPVLPGVDGEGLLLQPTGKIKACVVAIPDADWSPEVIVGLAKQPALHAEESVRPVAGRAGLPGDRADADRPARHLVGKCRY